MSSQYDGLVFVVVVQRLFVFWLFELAKYIQSNGRQNATELESNVF